MASYKWAKRGACLPQSSGTPSTSQAKIRYPYKNHKSDTLQPSNSSPWHPGPASPSYTSPLTVMISAVNCILDSLSQHSTNALASTRKDISRNNYLDWGQSCNLCWQMGRLPPVYDVLVRVPLKLQNIFSQTSNDRVVSIFWEAVKQKVWHKNLYSAPIF